MKKLIPVLGFLAIINISFNLLSCSKDDDFVSLGYSVWMEMTDADSIVYAKARAAYLNDPANEGTTDFAIMQFLSHNPNYVRTEAVENGMNYQFACSDDYIVTIYKGNGAEVGKVIEIEAGYDKFPRPIPPDPRKRDTLIY